MNRCLSFPNPQNKAVQESQLLRFAVQNTAPSILILMVVFAEGVKRGRPIGSVSKKNLEGTDNTGKPNSGLILMTS